MPRTRQVPRPVPRQQTGQLEQQAGQLAAGRRPGISRAEYKALQAKRVKIEAEEQKLLAEAYGSWDEAREDDWARQWEQWGTDGKPLKEDQNYTGLGVDRVWQFADPRTIDKPGLQKASGMFKQYKSAAECRKEWAKAKPDERLQILKFVRRHTENGSWGSHGKGKVPEIFLGGTWQLVRFSDLDTGKAILSVAFRLEAGGLSGAEIREVVGLPKLAGAAKVSLGKVGSKPVAKVKPAAKGKHPIPKRKGK